MQEKNPKITHWVCVCVCVCVCVLLQVGSVCGPVLRGPPGGGVLPPGSGPGPCGSVTQKGPRKALLHGELWRHLPHDVSAWLSHLICWKCLTSWPLVRPVTVDVDVVAGVPASASSSPGCSWSWWCCCSCWEAQFTMWSVGPGTTDSCWRWQYANARLHKPAFASSLHKCYMPSSVYLWWYDPLFSPQFIDTPDLFPGLEIGPALGLKSNINISDIYRYVMSVHTRTCTQACLCVSHETHYTPVHRRKHILARLYYCNYYIVAFLAGL